jgi:hypothetical protein
MPLKVTAKSKSAALHTRAEGNKPLMPSDEVQTKEISECAAAVAQVLINDEWRLLGEELREGKTTRAELLLGSLVDPKVLVAVAESYPIVVTRVVGDESSVAEGKSNAVEAQQTILRSMQSLILGIYARRCDRRFLDAVITLEEIRRCLTQGISVQGSSDQLHRVAEFIEPVTEQREQRLRDITSAFGKGEAPTLPPGTLKALGKRLENALRGLIGVNLECAPEPSRHFSTHAAKADWNAKAPELAAFQLLTLINEKMSPLLALAVHIALPWWLPLEKLPHAVRRYERLFTKTQVFRTLVASWIERAWRNQRKAATLSERQAQFLLRAKKSRLKIIRHIVMETLLEVALPENLVEEIFRKPDPKKGEEGDSVSSSEDGAQSAAVQRRFLDHQIRAARKGDAVLPRKGYPWEW